MLEPIATPHTTDVLIAPGNWDESHGPCLDLPVHHHDGIYCSWYRIGWADRFRILIGYPVRLAVFTRAHPPVALEVRRS